MGIIDFFRHEQDLPVVFTGEYLEAELVKGMLAEEGFHPYELSDLPRPYLGSVGMGRVLVPPEELEGAREFLERVREEAERAGGGPQADPGGLAPGEAEPRTESMPQEEGES
jgi:hypothetical protein